jgi:hypothetical protein
MDLDRRAGHFVAVCSAAFAFACTGNDDFSVPGGASADSTMNTTGSGSSSGTGGRAASDGTGRGGAGGSSRSSRNAVGGNGGAGAKADPPGTGGRTGSGSGAGGSTGTGHQGGSRAGGDGAAGAAGSGHGMGGRGTAGGAGGDAGGAGRSGKGGAAGMGGALATATTATDAGSDTSAMVADAGSDTSVDAASSCLPDGTLVVTATTGDHLEYFIGGMANPDLILCRGSTYDFSLDVTSIHPFWIKTLPTTGTANAYVNGVSNNGAAFGDLVFVVPPDAPDTLYYACENDASMHGTIRIVTR